MLARGKGLRDGQRTVREEMGTEVQEHHHSIHDLYQGCHEEAKRDLRRTYYTDIELCKKQLDSSQNVIFCRKNTPTAQMWKIEEISKPHRRLLALKLSM